LLIYFPQSSVVSSECKKPCPSDDKKPYISSLIKIYEKRIVHTKRFDDYDILRIFFVCAFFSPSCSPKMVAVIVIGSIYSAFEHHLQVKGLNSNVPSSAFGTLP